MWNLKYDTNELIQKTEIDSQTQKTNLWLPKGTGGVGGINQEFGISRCKLLYMKQINNKVLPYSTGNYTQYLVINYNGKEYEKNIYTQIDDRKIDTQIQRCITESFHCIQKRTQFCKLTILQFKKKRGSLQGMEERDLTL